MIDLLDIHRIRAAQYLKRWHMVQMNHYPSLADHSFQVAMIAAKLSAGKDESTRWQVVEYALCHDMAETAFGDIPPTARVNKSDIEERFWGKSIYPDYYVKSMVKLADKVDNYLTFKECGVNRVQFTPGETPKSIEQKLVDDLREYVSNFDPDVQTKVEEMIK